MERNVLQTARVGHVSYVNGRKVMSTIRSVADMLDQIAEYVISYPDVNVTPFDDGARGEIGYRADSTKYPARWIFRFRDLHEFYKGDDPRAEQIRNYMSTPAGRQHLPSLLASFLQPEPEPEFVGPLKTRFHIIEEWSCQ